MDKRRDYHDFLSKVFCLTVPKNFVGEHFGVSKNFEWWKFFMHQSGGYQVSSSKTFYHTKPKKFVRERHGASDTFVHRKKIVQMMGISLNSLEKSLSHGADNICRRNLLGFEKFLVSESLKQKRGESSRLCRKFFCVTGPKKFHLETILCFRKLLVGRNPLWIG